MRQPRFPVLWFFLFTYVLTAITQGVNLYVMHRLSVGTAGGAPIAETAEITESPVWVWRPYGFYLTNAGPSLVGVLMTLCMYGLPGIRRVGVQLAPWSVGRAWPVLVACLFIPLLGVVAALIQGTPPDSWSLSTYLFGAIVSGGLIGSGMCEELGWRGFALPHLQQRYSALVSSLIIGVAWALWHWPNYFIASHPHPYWAFAAAIPMGITAAILYTWAYNSTGGSLFAVVVLHGATVSTPILPDSAGAAALIVPSLYLLLAIGLVLRYGATNLSWRERVVPEPPSKAANVCGGSGEL